MVDEDEVIKLSCNIRHFGIYLQFVNKSRQFYIISLTFDHPPPKKKEELRDVRFGLVLQSTENRC